MLKLNHAIYCLMFLSIYGYGQEYELIRKNDIPVLIKNDSLINAWAGGINSSTLSSYDFNGDGVQDLLLFDRQHNKNLVFVSTSGKLRFSLEYSHKVPSLSSYGIFYDFDKDGKKDLFTSTSLGIKVFHNESILNNINFVSKKDPVYTNSFGTQVNMDITSFDLPAFSDVDNDGDMDILHFRSSEGASLDLEKNQSMEMFAKPDSLIFKNLDNCWGGFMEQSCNSYNFGYDCRINFRLEHGGTGSVLAFDSDNDSDKDLIVSKEDCNNFVYLQNQGNTTKPVFIKSTPYFNSPSVASKLQYPLSFYEDFDNDNIKDLVVTNGNPSPQDTANATQNVWFFKNEGSNSIPNLSLKTKSFIQNSMLDFGINARPLFVDMDGDTDLDLLVSNSSSNYLHANIVYFKNNGTLSNPSFILSDSNFLSLREDNFDDIILSYSDLNKDNFKDLIITSTKNAKTTISLYINSSSTGFVTNANPVLVNINLPQIFSIIFTDFNRDGFSDALAGGKNGNLYYFQNIGSASNPDFIKIDSTLGGIKSNVDKTNLNVGLIETDLNQDGKDDLLIGNDLGSINVYESYKDQNSTLFTSKTLIADGFNNQIGKHLSLSAGDLNQNSSQQLMVGNENGGIMLFNIKPPITSYLGKYQKLNDVKVFPNPSKGDFTVENFNPISYRVCNYFGEEILIDNTKSTNHTVKGLKSGFYFLIVRNSKGEESVKKIVVE